MTIKWSKNYTLLLLMLIAIIFGAWYYGELYFLNPTREEIQDLEITLSEQSQIIEQASSSAYTEDELSQRALLVRNILPTEVAVDQVIDQVFQVAGRYDLNLSVISLSGTSFVPDGINYPQQIEAIDYQLVMSAASVAEIEQFIEDLENFDRLIEIIDLNLNTQGEDQADVTLTIRAFYNADVIME